MAKKPNPGLLHALESMKRQPRHKPCWVDELPEETRKELLAYREKYRAGKLASVPTDRQIYEAVVEATGTDIAPTCFYDWLKRRKV